MGAQWGHWGGMGGHLIRGEMDEPFSVLSLSCQCLSSSNSHPLVNALCTLTLSSKGPETEAKVGCDRDLSESGRRCSRRILYPFNFLVLERETANLEQFGAILEQIS